jgi:hypothetical protein
MMLYAAIRPLVSICSYLNAAGISTKQSQSASSRIHPPRAQTLSPKVYRVKQKSLCRRKAKAANCYESETAPEENKPWMPAKNFQNILDPTPPSQRRPLLRLRPLNLAIPCHFLIIALPRLLPLAPKPAITPEAVPPPDNLP